VEKWKLKNDQRGRGWMITSKISAQIEDKRTKEITVQAKIYER
jgi:hypothetical protein